MHCAQRHSSCNSLGYWGLLGLLSAICNQSGVRCTCNHSDSGVCVICSVCALLHSRHSGVGRGAAAACDIVCKLVHMCILFCHSWNMQFCLVFGHYSHDACSITALLLCWLKTPGLEELCNSYSRKTIFLFSASLSIGYY